jgi:5-methylcytosine-specific restriction enzyme subunit McrC
MASILLIEKPAIQTIELAEWSEVGPTEDARLKGMSLGKDAQAHRIADVLRARVDIREAHDGLKITTTSFVGRVDIGPLRIIIRPKLPAMPLTRLLRYAYGLRDLSIIEETQTPVAQCGLEDLLIAMLAAETDELLHRGLSRHHVPLESRLESPRGHILISELARRGGVMEARLSCRYFERLADWHLNQVLRAGIIVAAGMSSDHELRRRLHRSADRLGSVSSKVRLDIRDVDRAERGLTRLTSAYAPALTIIRLLCEMRGVIFDTVSDLNATPGFLFDMNVFFQRLLSRFLRENLTTHRIEDEFVIQDIFSYAPSGNPKRRIAPKPRPDFGLFEEKRLIGFLDAKYRDIWARGFPVDWLYQGSIYALASPARVSVLLYATMSEDACGEKIDIQQPIAWSNRPPGSVIFRPVPIPTLARVLSTDSAHSLSNERQALAESLVSLSGSVPPFSSNGNTQRAP